MIRIHNFGTDSVVGTDGPAGKYIAFIPKDEAEAKKIYQKNRKMLDPAFGDN